MKYTRSKDGVERATIIVRLRYSREEIKEIKELAAKDGGDGDWRGWIESHAGLGIEEAMTDCGGELEQRYGRGGG